MSIIKIDLRHYISRHNQVVSGRHLGTLIKEQINLDYYINLEQIKIEVIIPENIISISTPFFLALFGNFVRKIGESKFRERVIFFTDDEDLINDIDTGISKALLSNF